MKIATIIFSLVSLFAVAFSAHAQEATKYDATKQAAASNLKPFVLEITGKESKGRPSQVCTLETATGITEIKCGKGDVVVVSTELKGAVCFNAQAAARAIEMKSSRIAGYCNSDYKQKG